MLGRFSERRNAYHYPGPGVHCSGHVGGVLRHWCEKAQHRLGTRHSEKEGTPLDTRHNTECQTPSARRFEASSQERQVFCVRHVPAGWAAGGWGRSSKCRAFCGGMDVIRDDHFHE